MRNYLLVLWVMVFFLVVGCATPEPRVKVLEKPVYVEKPKRVDVNTVISQLSHQISSTMLEQNKRRVAVMNFPLVTGEMTDLGIYLSDKLTNSLFQYRDKFEVVERTRLESVLKEIKLGFTGIIDDKAAQSIGKILGADAIVIGTITDLGSEIDINIRMLGTERANVIAVASAILEKSDVIVKLMANVRITEPGIEDPFAPLFVQVWSDKKEYSQREKIKIYLKGNKPFYARVVYRDSAGSILQVLPNPYRQENYFNGGVIYEIPSGNDRFELEVSPPFGEENIVLYASTSQLGDIGLKPRGGVYIITTKPEEIREKTRGVKIKEKTGSNEAVTSEFYEERVNLKTTR